MFGRRIARSTMLSIGLVVVLQIVAGLPSRVAAVPLMIQTKTAVANNRTARASFTKKPIVSHLLIVVCGSRANTTFSVPTGFSTAKNEAGTPSQGIFYKISDGYETSAISCTGTTSGRMSIQIYEYSGNVITEPLDAVNTVSSAGTSSTQPSGSLTSTNADDLLFAAVTANSNTTFSSWSNTFTERSDFLSGTQAHFGVADRAVTTTGTYSTSATAGVSGAYRGQIAAFKFLPSQLVADIVDASDASVANPSASFSTQNFGFSCKTSTGTLGEASQKLRITNTTSAPAWLLSVAPTDGASALWSDNTSKYDVNDPTTGGCSDGADTDTFAGQLTINPSVATLTPGTGCTSTGVSLGASTSLNEGVSNSAVLATGASTATINCSWDITGVVLSQTIPAEQPSSSGYSLDLTLTLLSQ